jgi:hypothetical protein
VYRCGLIIGSKISPEHWYKLNRILFGSLPKRDPNNQGFEKEKENRM